MFGRKKTVEVPDVGAEVDARPGAKNRPTPKRRDQEAARKRPLVPADRKAAKSAAGSAAREARAKQREAMLTGEEKYLPARDRGPEKRHIRDAIDSRWGVGEFLLPVMFVVVVLNFVAPKYAGFLSLLVIALLVATVLNSVLLWRQLKKEMTATFGQPPPSGSAMYAGMRAFQMRRMRMPKPQVPRGSLRGGPTS